MTGRAFGERYDDIDGDPEARGLLDYLDVVETVPEVREAKQAASRALGLGPGSAVADIGCGTGVDLPFLVELVKPGGRVAGVDISAAAIEVARARTSGLAGIELHRAGVERLPFEDGSFDACRMDRTLQHVANPELALREVRRVTRPGGRLVVHERGVRLAMPDGLSVPRAAAKALRAPDDQAWLPFMMPLLLTRTGFRQEDIDVLETVERSLDVMDKVLRLRVELADNAAAVGRPELAGEWWQELESADLELTTVSVRIEAVAV